MTAQNILKDTDSKMDKSVEHTLREFGTLHTGKASTSMVEGVSVDAYGTGAMKLRDIAAISTPDSRTIEVQPWDKSTTEAVAKAILSAGLGLNPVTAGNNIRCPIPDLSGDRRKELVKTAKGMTEEGLIRVRGVRREAMDLLKKLQKAGDISEDELKRFEKEVQAKTDKHTKAIEVLLKQKTEELLAV